MWQELRNELHPRGLEIVTVGLDTRGAEGCRPFIEAARPDHPALIDTSHRVAELFGVVNIPNSVWIDEDGVIVRPAEPAPPPRRAERPSADGSEPAASGVPDRLISILGEAAKIRVDAESYHAALRDWVEHGAASEFALSPDEVVERSIPRDTDRARGHAHFTLATHLEQQGHHAAAVEHFRLAHQLVPDNFSFKRQAWSLEPGDGGPFDRFWQGPSVDAPEAWPYDGDWLTDVRAAGAENYYPEWKA